MGSISNSKLTSHRLLSAPAREMAAADEAKDNIETVEETQEQKENESQNDKPTSNDPQYTGTVTGKYQWDEPSKGKAADDDVKGEAISKYSWSDGKKAVIYIELDGLDDVADDALTT